MERYHGDDGRENNNNGEGAGGIMGTVIAGGIQTQQTGQGWGIMAGEEYLELTPPWHSCRDGMLQFLPVALALDSKAGTGLVIPVNRKVEHTTMNINAGVALDPSSWDQRLDRWGLVSRLLIE